MQNQILKKFLDKGLLVKPSLLNELNNLDLVKIEELIKYCVSKNLDIIDERVLENLNTKENISKNTIITNYVDHSRKIKVGDFVTYFNKRYELIKRLLLQRGTLKNITSIKKLLTKRERENVSIVGIVSKIDYTKNKNIIISLEDPTGLINVLFNKNRRDLFKEAEEIVLDDVLGINGINGGSICFANQIIWPDVPYNTTLKKSKEDINIAFLSDIQLGSKNFLKEPFNKFIKWTSGKIGNDQQKQNANNLRYIFLIGDLVDGVGIYPNQIKELEIEDIYEQYALLAEYLKKIPENVKIIACPGNHDMVRLAEPQPRLSKKLTDKFFDFPNINFVTNPSKITILKKENFPGFKILLYHGFSSIYFAYNVNLIKHLGNIERTDLVMKLMLKKRHLAPTYNSSLKMPDPNNDFLFIDEVPDILATGHTHKTIATNYKGVSLICASCWQKKTSFNEKIGQKPEPGRVPIVNLKTRKSKILKFIK